jgi:RNA polymerase sigma-70 factor, ECF subfamily
VLVSLRFRTVFNMVSIEDRPCENPGVGVKAPQSDPKTDRALMIRIREGDRRAFRILVERHWAALVGYAEGILNGDDVAQDVVQETFVRVWRRRADWTPDAAVTSYLYRITRNLAFNARRDRIAEMDRRERGGQAIISSMPGADPHQDVIAGCLQTEVEEAIRCLPERRREVFVLSRFHHLTYQEISLTMGIAPQTVANQMRAALADLRVALAHHLHPPT